MDNSVTRRGQPCWYRVPKVCLSLWTDVKQLRFTWLPFLEVTSCMVYLSYCRVNPSIACTVHHNKKAIGVSGGSDCCEWWYCFENTYFSHSEDAFPTVTYLHPASWDFQWCKLFIPQHFLHGLPLEAWLGNCTSLWTHICFQEMFLQVSMWCMPPLAITYPWDFRRKH